MKKDSNNNLLLNDAIEQNENTGSKLLTVTSNSSVQPASLLRLGVFVPTNKAKSGIEVIDASELLQELEISRREGYTKIVIKGERLNVNVDLKIWMGIVHAFSKYGISSNTIQLPFIEFARLCQYPTVRLSTRLRNEIQESLTRIRGKTITLSTPNAKGAYVTGLLKTGRYDVDADVVELEADSMLWELYRADYLTLLRRQPIAMLPKNEAAQALYTFLASLPARPADISFTRLRARLMLTNRVADQNRVIRQALTKLKDIGYLDYLLKKEGKETWVKVLSRNNNLQKSDV